MTGPRLCGCGGCARPAHPDRSTVCTHCTWILDRDLGEAAVLADELDVTFARLSTGPGGRAHLPRATGRTPLPYAVHAAEAADQLRRTLDRWASRLEHPDRARPLHTAGLARWLTHHRTALTTRDDAGLAIEQIGHAVRTGWRAVDRPADRAYAGTCNATRHDLAGAPCPEQLYTAPGQDTVTCRTCGATHDPHERRTRMQHDLDQTLMTGAQIARLAAYFGHCDRERARNLIKVWATRSIVTAHGHTPTGDPLYPFGEVLSKLLTARSRTAVG